MPELPEVETVRKSLAPIIGHSIEDITINRESAVNLEQGALDLDSFYRQQVSNNLTFTDISRKAKYLIFHLSDGSGLLGHLKMTGGFRYVSPSEPLKKHTHLIWHLSNGYEMRFIDQRCFGYVAYYADIETIYTSTAISKLAPEPGLPAWGKDIKSYFAKAIEKYRHLKSPIKAILLDQEKIVSGLGNIYVDEVLFASGIHPQRILSSLTGEEAQRLYKNISEIIRAAIERGGTTFRDYVDANGRRGQYADELNVYGRKNQLCYTCKTPISYIKAAGRGTHVCPQCQPITG